MALGATLALSACGYVPEDWVPPAGFLGREINPPPPPVVLTQSGGLHGELIAGSDQSPVPKELVDSVVGSELRRWLSPEDRLALAEASQQAAVAERNAKVAWGAQPAPPPPEPDQSAPGPAGPAAAPGAAGWAAAISDPYRAPHGELCRNVRQALTRADDVIVQAVSLCREDLAIGGSIWALAQWP